MQLSLELTLALIKPHVVKYPFAVQVIFLNLLI